MAKVIRVRIAADTRAFRISLFRAGLALERRRWKRAWLRFLIWRVRRESAP